MCRFFNVLRSGYYDYVKRMDILTKDLLLAEKIKECQDKCGRTYGYRSDHLWLEKENIHHNPKTILKVMQKYNHYRQSEERNIVTTAIIHTVMKIF